MLWLSKIVDTLMGNNLKLDVDKPVSVYSYVNESHLKAAEKSFKSFEEDGGPGHSLCIKKIFYLEEHVMLIMLGIELMERVPQE